MNNKMFHNRSHSESIKDDKEYIANTCDLLVADTEYVPAVRNFLQQSFSVNEVKKQFLDVFKLEEIMEDTMENSFECFVYKCQLKLPLTLIRKFPDHPREVYVKIEPILNDNDWRYNGFEAERQFYKFTEKLITTKRIPHFARSYGYYSLPYIPCPKKYKIKHTKINRYDFIVLKSTGGESLRSFLRYRHPSIKEIYLILFQIFYCLRCFQLLKISHNDLHFKNIHVTKYPLPITLTYKIGTKIWKISSCYIIFIIDFNRVSNHTEGPFNLELNVKNFDNSVGQTNWYRENDTFNVVSSLHDYNIKSLNTFFDKIFVNKNKYLQRLKEYLKNDENNFPDYLRVDENHTDYFRSTRVIFRIVRRLLRSVNEIHQVITPAEINFFTSPRSLKLVNFFPINNNYHSLDKTTYCKENPNTFGKFYPHRIIIYNSVISELFPEIIKYKLQDNWLDNVHKLINKLEEKNINSFQIKY